MKAKYPKQSQVLRMESKQEYIANKGEFMSKESSN